jgi:glycine dehydrogenase subunit 1
MALLGFDGLRKVALRSQQTTANLVAGLTAISGVERLFDGPHFHEAALRLDRPVAPVLEDLAQQNILGGYDLSADLSADYSEFGNALLVCATETKTAADIDAYVAALQEVLQ